MITYSHCPICKSNNINSVFKVKDYTVSNEIFEIVECNNCTLRFTQNVANENEIGKYYASDNYISHSDTQVGLVNKLYHAVRKKTLQAKQKLIARKTNLSKGSILDIGCGTGAFLNCMQQVGWQIKGLEPDASARDKAKALYNLDTAPSHELFNIPTSSFDAITMWHVLEHVHDLQNYIAQLKKILKPNGKIFIAVPNYTSYDASHYKELWAAYDVPRHLYHFSPEAITKLITQHDLKVESILPMWYDSFYVSMLSEKYKNSKGNIIKAFWHGLVSNAKTVLNKQKCSSLIYVLSH
jgi:2-polyprenyl-3-methyl-5-hydroxy-6-metoxy-1,4-benzoquinol methylase